MAAPRIAAEGGETIPSIREARVPQARPVASASAACRGDTQAIRPMRRSTEGPVVVRRLTPLRRRRARAEAVKRPLVLFELSPPSHIHERLPYSTSHVPPTTEVAA